MQNKLTLLELFSGSSTVSNISSNLGFDSWSVDFNAKLNPRVCLDIMSFDYSIFPSYFDFIWASPDCRLFSRDCDPSNWHKIINKYRQYTYIPLTPAAVNSLSLLIKTITIIKYYKPLYYIIENPVGRMRHIPQLQQFSPFRYSVNYKDWGFDYSKETDLYTNAYLPFPQKKVIRFGKSVKTINSSYKRALIPPALILYILHILFKI